MASLILTQAELSPLSPLLVLFLVGVPLLDLIAVTTQRLLTGGRPFRADQEHLHHKLLKLGFSHHQVVLILYLMQIGLVVLASQCRWNTDVSLVGLYALLLGGVGAVYYGVYSGTISSGQCEKWSAGALYWRTWLQARSWLSQGALYGLAIGVLAFFLLGLGLPPTLPHKGIYLLLGVGMCVLVGLWGGAQASLLTTRMGLYLASTFVLYGVEHALHGATLWQHGLFQGFFGLLVIGLLVAIHLDTENRFTPNPMDYLLLFLALVMPFLLNVQLGMVEVGEMMAKLIVLFFACEVLLQAFSTKVRHMGVLSGGALLTLATRALW